MKIIDEPVYRKIVRYNPNNQKIGITTRIESITGRKLKSFNKINSSNLNINASQVQKTIKLTSVIIAIALFEYRLRDKI